MNPLSRDLGNALLNRHRQHAPDVLTPEDITQIQINQAIISYKDLLKDIGAPEGLARSIGEYLYEIAVWSEERHHPPLNALAVNGTFKMPGVGYFTAPQGKNWEREIRDCLVHKGYPNYI